MVGGEASIVFGAAYGLCACTATGWYVQFIIRPSFTPNRPSESHAIQKILPLEAYSSLQSFIVASASNQSAPDASGGREGDLVWTALSRDNILGEMIGRKASPEDVLDARDDAERAHGSTSCLCNLERVLRARVDAEGFLHKKAQ
jgi:hypothetical protein